MELKHTVQVQPTVESPPPESTSRAGVMESTLRKDTGLLPMALVEVLRKEAVHVGKVLQGWRLSWVGYEAWGVCAGGGGKSAQGLVQLNRLLRVDGSDGAAQAERVEKEELRGRTLRAGDRVAGEG